MKRKMWWLKRSSSPHLCARYLMLFCTVGFVLLPTSYVWANPAGEAVVGGAATFQRDGNTLTVNQATDRLAVDWQSFNIGPGESTHFNMPSSTSAALNRVIGGNPTSIYGSLSANGILYLINSSGILVGPGGTVNAAAFMASTLDVSTEQFMNAKNGAGMSFLGSSAESIINQGNITAEKGSVFFIAQKVENRGTVNAVNGTVGMVGSGQNTEVMVHEVGGKGFAIRVAQLQGEAATGSNRDLPDGEELLNEGSINAAQVELNASGNVYALAIRNSGTVRAKAVLANADGTVRLDGGLGDVINTGKMYAKNAGDDATAAGGKIDFAGQNITASPESIITAAGGEQGGNGGSVKIDSQDTTLVQGKVDVSAPSAGAKGGKVQLLGEKVGMLDGAKVDASGGAGGGTVLAGGDYLGGLTPSADLKDLAKQEAEPVKNAKATVMADTAEIKADATVSGEGGKIVLWSDEYTGFYGDLFARGGVQGGNGGFIETSSKNNLQAVGSANASASFGKAGLWLLDPQNVSIETAGTGTLTAGIFDPSTPNATIAPATIVAALDGGTSVTITTGSTGTQAGNITVVNSVTTVVDTNTDLTLAAANNIVLNAGAELNLSSNTGGANISILADFDASGSGTITTNAGALITAGTTGTVTLQGSGAIGTGDLVTAQDVVFQGALAGSSIGVNDATGLVQISSGALTTNLAATGTVTIGRTDGTGTISIGSGGTLNLAGEGYNLALRGASSSAVFNFTGANTLSLKAGGVLTLNLGTGSLFSPGSATTDFTSATGGMVLTSSGQIGSADSSAPFLTSMANLSGTTTGSINITDAGGLTVNGALSSGNANINLSAGTGGAFANTGGTISAGAGVITLTANTINIANTVTGNGGINLVPDAAGTTVAINDATGTFSLTAAELGSLASTGVVSIGLAASSSAFNIGSSGPIDLSTETYDLTILKTSGATTFNFTAGNTLTLPNNGILSFNVGSGTIQGASLNTTDITIGGNGTISFNSGAVGTTQRLKTSSANYGTSTTSGNVFLTSTRTGGVNFGGAFSVGANNLSLDSAGAVTQDQTITASGLELLGSGSVTLNNVANNIVTLAGNVTGSGFSYTDSNAFTLGTVNTTTGLTTTSGNTILQALTGLLNVTSALSVSGGNATLQTSVGAITTGVGGTVSATGGNVTLQSAGGGITTGAAISSTGGTVTLQSTGGAILTGAGGTVSATGGTVTIQSTGGAITTGAAISSAGGTVTLQSTGGGLTLGGVVSAVDQSINLISSGNLAVNSSVNAAQGVVTLTASTIGLAASVTGNGGINLIPLAGTAVGIGAVPTSTFGLTTTEMNFLVSTGTVTFGSSGTRVGAIGLAEGGSISLATNSYNLVFYGSGNVTFGGTLTMGNNRGLTLDVGTGTIISAASGIDLAIGGNGTLGITSSGAVGQTGNGALSTQIANLAGATVTGAFSMDNNSANLLVNGAVNAAANSVTLTAGTGILSNTSAINSTGTVTLTTDSQDIQATIGGTGATVVLLQQTTGRAIQLGTDGPLYSLTSAELGFLKGTTARIGATTSSGITITAPILMPNVSNLNLTSSGISDLGGVTGISVTGLALTSNGLISLTGSGNSFSTVATLLSGSSAPGASITINNAVSMAIATVDGLVGLNNSAAGNGTISLTSGGSITQTAAMTTGTGAITVATTTLGSDILLSTQANNLSSSLFTLGGAQANVLNFGLRNTSASAVAPVLTGAIALNNVTLTYNSAPLAVPGIDITGNLSVTSGGAMTQSGNILVDGSTTLAAGANAINLSTFAGNDFSSLSALSATGSTISLKDLNGFLMGTTTATGNLTLNAGAAVTQSGIITTPGLELLGAGSFAFGTQNNAITTLAGNVTGDVNFLDNTGYAIGTVNTVGLTSLGNITLSSSAAVTQSQLLAAVGLELLGTGNYTLANTGNAVTTLAGNVTGNVSFLDNTGYDIGTVNTVGLTSGANITLSSTAAVTQSQLLSATGLELLGTAGSFTLTSTANAITTLAGNTGAVSFLDQTGATPFTIGTVNTVGLTTTGDTTLDTGTATGTVTQSQKIVASGLELLGSGAYTLSTSPLNDVTTLAGNTTGAVSYTDANGFAVGTVNTAGLTTAGAANINLTTATGVTGILTTTAAITAGTTGTVTATANQVGIGAAITGNGGINLVPDAAATTMALNDATGTFSLSATELQFLNSTGIVKIGSSASTGTLNIGDQGSIDLSATSYNLTLQKTSGATTFNFPATTTLTLADNKTLTFSLGTGTVNGSASNTTDITIGGTTGGITLTSGAIGATQRLKTAVSQYNASTISGNASLTELNDLVIAGAFSVGAFNLSLSSGGVVTQTFAVTASGLELLGLGSYTLTNTGNAITTLAGNVTGNVSFLDNTGYAIGTVNTVGLTSASNITLSSTGAVTQSQLVAAAGLELLGSTGTFTLNNFGNDISTLAGSTTAGSLNFTDSDDFAVGTVNTTKGITTTSGAVNLTALGAGNLSVQQAIRSGATSTLTAGGEFASETSPSGLGTVEVTAGTLTITSATINLASNIKANGGMTLKPSTVAQTIGLNSVTGGFDLSTAELLNLISSGTVIPSGTVTIGRSVDGTGTYTVGGAGAFDLSATSYDLTLEGLTSAIAFSNGVTMGNGRTLNLAAGGAITSAATGTDITIGDGFNSGTLSISSASTVGISGNVLSTAIDKLAASTVGTTFLSNSRALQATGAIGVTGNLNLITGGTLSQSGTGAVTVSGTSAFTVPTGTDVLLAEAANNFGALTLTAAGASTFRDLKLRNISASATVPTVNAYRNVAFNFDNAAVALPALTLTGTLDVTAGGGPITQTGILDIGGNSSFASTGFGITLGNIGNIFNSNVSLTTTALQNATLVDSTALVLGTSNVSALLNMTSGGSITQATGTTLTTGAGVTASFTSATPLVADRDLLLSGLNSISGQVAFGGNLEIIRDVSIQNSSTGAEVPVLEGLINLQDLTLNYTGVTAFEAPTLQSFAFLRNISFSTVGPITQKSGGISNLGAAAFTVTGAANAITLDDALNNFGLAVSLKTNNGNGTLRESSGLVLGTSTLGTGGLGVTTAAGSTTQTGTITASQFNIDAGGSVSLALSNLINTVAANVTGVGNSFSFANGKALIIGTAGLLSGITTASGDVSVSTAASIVSPLTGLITVNNAVFAGGAGSVLIRTQSGANLVINANVGASGAGSITLLAEGGLTTAGTGVLIGSANTGAIVMKADSDQSNAGTLTISANDIVGSTLNSSDYTLSGADLSLLGIVRQSGVGAKITLTPTLATGTVALGNNTAGGTYAVTAAELLNIQSAGTVVVGGSNYLGDISLGNINLVGNVFKNFLLQSSPGGLTTVGNLPSTGTFSVVSSAVNVEIDSRVQLNGNNLNISTTGGNNSAGANVNTQQEFFGGFTLALLNGGLIVDGGTDGDVVVNGSLGISEQLGRASISGHNVTVNSIDTNGGVISLISAGNGELRNAGVLNSTSREDIFAPAPTAAGSITLKATGAGAITVEGSVITRGAQGKTVTTVIGTVTLSIDQNGGPAGSVTLSAPLGTINVGGPIVAYGGNAVNNSLSRGPDGTITVDGYDVGLTRDQIAYYGTKFDIKGRNNLIFASQPNYLNPTSSVGGASIIMNQLLNGITALNDPTIMQNLVLTYGTTGLGELYMGSGSSVQTFGGDFSASRMIAPTTSFVGGMTLGEIYTTGRGISSGSVSLGSIAFNAPVSVNFINTSGGDSSATSTSSQSGISGGNVEIYGTALRIGEVDTRGSSPLATAKVPAIGGTGGSLTIDAGTVSILGNISTSGGVGAGATGVRSTGGSGGQISITALSGLILDSINLSTPTFIFDSSGSTGVNGGLSGSAGKIDLTGSIIAAAGGVVSSGTTAATTLDLRFSGQASSGAGSAVTLGATSSDAIILGTLITAGGSGVTRGTFQVNGALQVDTLSTAAQPYSIALLGTGSVIQNRVTFLNSGTVTIGGAVGVTTTFNDGFDALTGSGTSAPSSLQLGGTIKTVTATGSMLANTTVLVANTTLNSAGNIIQIGALDGGFTLDLAAGVATGSTTLSGAVGSITPLGKITVASGVSGLLNFKSTVSASAIETASGSQTQFDNDVTLSGAGTNLGGIVTLNNVAYADDSLAVLSFLGAGAKTFSGTTKLEGGPIEFGGLGDYAVSGTISGAQNLTLSGGVGIVGTKIFTGDVAIGSVSGGPTIEISGGNVTFGNLITTDGITSTANITLQGITILGLLNANSALTGNVDLIGATLISAGTIALGDEVGDSVKLGGEVIVSGPGVVNVKGAVTNNAGFTSFTQTGIAGKIRFDENVTLDTGSMTLNGNVDLSGMSFSTLGTVTLGDDLSDSITLSTAAVELTGTGTFSVNGVVVGGGQDLTLSLAGEKTFTGGVSDLGTLALTAGKGTFGSTVSGVVFNQSGGVAVLNGNGTFSGGSTLGGTMTFLNGIIFSSGTTEVTGGLTSTGATTMTGGLITLNTTSALTSSSGTLTLGNAVTLSENTTLAGAGAYQLNGAVNGTKSLTLSDAGAKTFSGAVGTTSITQNDASGLVTFAEDVTMSGAGSFYENLVLDGLTMTGSTLTFGSAATDTAVISGATTITAAEDITLKSATTLNAALALSDGGATRVTTLSGTVTGGSSNLTVITDDLVINNTVQTGSGVVSVTKKDLGLVKLGGVDSGTFLDAAEISRISTSGGLTVTTGSDITINKLELGDTAQITGDFKMVTTGGNINVADSVTLNVFGGSAALGSLTAIGSTLSKRLTTQYFTDLTLGVGGLEYDGLTTITLAGLQVAGDILVTSVSTMMVNGSVRSNAGDIGLESTSSYLTIAQAVNAAGNIDLAAAGDVIVSNRLTASTTIGVDSGRYFINSYSGNPFQSADTRILTTDLFTSSWPLNGAVPGLQVVYGVNSIGQVGANQIGVSTTLLAGNAGPYILEFTTGTGQPYILAQQTAVPPVMIPAQLTGGSGFAQRVSYSADEVEMMNPAERSAYENQLRQTSARVILETDSGEGEEIGTPTEGRTPQAANPVIKMPQTPTAQVLLEGKPLAGGKLDQERGDATRIIKLRPTRAVALRAGYQGADVMEVERMAAEVNVGAAPVVQNR